MDIETQEIGSEVKHIFVILCRKSSGMIARVTGLLNHYGVLIESLTVACAEDKDHQRLTILIKCTTSQASRIKIVLRKLHDVVRMVSTRDMSLMYKEMALVRIETECMETRRSIEKIARQFGALVAYSNKSHIVVQKSADEEEINLFVDRLKPFGVSECLRSGGIAYTRDRTLASIAS